MYNSAHFVQRNTLFTDIGRLMILSLVLQELSVNYIHFIDSLNRLIVKMDKTASNSLDVHR